MKTSISSISEGCLALYLSSVVFDHLILSLPNTCFYFGFETARCHDLNRNWAASFTCCARNLFQLERLQPSRTWTAFLWLPTSGGNSSALPAQGTGSISLFLQAQLQFIGSFPLSLSENQIRDAGLGDDDVARLKAKEYLWSLSASVHTLPASHAGYLPPLCSWEIPWVFPVRIQVFSLSIHPLLPPSIL